MAWSNKWLLRAGTTFSGFVKTARWSPRKRNFYSYLVATFTFVNDIAHKVATNVTATCSNSRARYMLEWQHSATCARGGEMCQGPVAHNLRPKFCLETLVRMETYFREFIYKMLTIFLC